MDFHSSSVQIYFVNKKGRTRTVQGILSNTQQRVDDLQNVNFVNSVQIKLSILKLTQIKVVLDPPFDEAVKLIQSGDIGLGFNLPTQDGSPLSIGIGTGQASASTQSFGINMMSIRCHHGGISSPLYKVVLLPPDLDISSSGIGITLNGIGMLQPSAKTSQKKVYKQKSGKEIIQELAGYNVQIVISNGDAKAQEALGKLQNISHNKSDFEQIKKILEASGCVIIDRGISGDDPSDRPVMEITSRAQNMSKAAKYTFVLFKDIDPSKNIFPILEMHTNINNVLLGQSLGVDTKTLNEQTKKPTAAEDSTVSAKTAANLTGGKSSSGNGTTAGADAENKGFLQKYPALSRAEKTTKDALNGLLSSALESSFSYDITTLGILDIQPGERVAVEVAGVPFLSSVYDLWAVEHDITTSGVTTKLTLARTGGIAALASQGVDSAQGFVSKVTSGKGIPSIPLPGGLGQ